MKGWKWFVLAAALTVVSACGKDDTTETLGPLQIQVLAGEAQRGFVGEVLAESLTVRVMNSAGDPVSGATVNFTVGNGGGTVSPTTARTNASGLARTSLTLPANAGATTVTATVAGVEGASVVFNANAANETFTAELTTAAETRAGNLVETSSASGNAVITVTVSGGVTTLHYSVTANNLTTGLTASHIHAPASVTATAPVRLPFAIGTEAGKTSVHFEGDFLSTTPLNGGMTFADLLTNMRNGNAYVNVHTTRYPAGEIRGQIVRGTP